MSWNYMLAVVACAASFLSGMKVTSDHYQAKEAAAYLAEVRDRHMRMEKNYVIGSALATKDRQTRVVTRTIIERVKEYVPVETPGLSAGWRVLHDAAALGIDPRAESIDHAAPVAAITFAETLVTNYATGHENADRLSACQQYIRDVVKPEGLK